MEEDRVVLTIDLKTGEVDLKVNDPDLRVRLGLEDEDELKENQ